MWLLALFFKITSRRIQAQARDVLEGGGRWSVCVCVHMQKEGGGVFERVNVLMTEITKLSFSGITLKVIFLAPLQC